MRVDIVVVAPAHDAGHPRDRTLFERYLLALADAGARVHVLTGAGLSDAIRDALTRDGGTVSTPVARTLDGAVAWERATFDRAEDVFDLIGRSSAGIVHVWTHFDALSAAIALTRGDDTARPRLVATLPPAATGRDGFRYARDRFVRRLPVDGLLPADLERDGVDAFAAAALTLFRTLIAPAEGSLA